MQAHFQPITGALNSKVRYRYGFQGQETDNELWAGGVSFKYRVEDARLGRFFSVDPLFRDFPNNGNYNFCENRVIANIDFEGKEAWNATKIYDSMDAFRFGMYVKKNNSINPLIKRTCEDLAIGLLTDYAHASGLSIKFKDSEGNVFSNKSNEFSYLHDFKFSVMEKFAANDMMNSGITKRIGNTQNEKDRLRIKPGDVLYSLNASTRAEHVQVVTENGIVSQQMVDAWTTGGAQHLVDNFIVGDNYAKIVQGNFKGTPSVFTEGEHEPDDSDYIGSEIQNGYYNLTSDTYVRGYKNNKSATTSASKTFNQEIHEVNYEEQNK